MLVAATLGVYNPRAAEAGRLLADMFFQVSPPTPAPTPPSPPFSPLPHVPTVEISPDVHLPLLNFGLQSESSAIRTHAPAPMPT